MKCYEVFLKLMEHGRTIGNTCVQIRAKNPFNAALKAERMVQGCYGESIWSRTKKVTAITENEFQSLRVA